MIKKIIFILLLLLLPLIGGFFAFLSTIPAEPSKNLQSTDAVVVLTGGSERLEAGLELLTNGYAEELFISGVGEGVAVKDLFSSHDFQPYQLTLLEQRVFLGYSARDTRQNAIEVSNWVQKKGHDKIRLVTSNYHIPRSLKEISSKLPATEIVTFPVFPESVKTKDWWNYSGSRDLLIMEYLKFLAVSVRVVFDISS